MPENDPRPAPPGGSACPGGPASPGGTAPLGDRQVARVGFGVMQLPGPGVLGPPRDRTEAVAVLRRAVELGIDHFDTAEFYGPHVANELIRDALHPYPESLTLVSKIGADRDEQGHWLAAQRPAQLRTAVEANLHTLAAERLDAVNLRLLDASHPGAEPVDLDDQLAEMAALRDEGKIGGIGLSNATTAQLEQALPVGIVCVQNAFSVLDRSGEPVLDLCRTHDIAWVPYFPLGSAFATMPKVTENETVRAAAAALSVTPSQVGLAWLLAHDRHILLIPGTSRLAHLEENAACGDVVLDAETMSALDALAAPAA